MLLLSFTKHCGMSIFCHIVYAFYVLLAARIYLHARIFLPKLWVITFFFFFFFGIT